MNLFFFQKKNRSLIALVISSLIILSYILGINFNIFYKKKSLTKNLEEDSIIISKNIVINKFNENGIMDHQLIASQITDVTRKKNKALKSQYQTNKSKLQPIELVKPKIKFFSEEDGITSISANVANVDEHQKDIYFNNEVLLINNASSLKVKANKIEVNTLSKKLYGSGNLSIHTASVLTKAKKMEADLNHKRLYLIGNTSSIIDSQNNTDENLVIYADKITLMKSDKKNNQQYDHFIAEGNPAYFFHNNKNNFDNVEASAEIIEFEADKRMLKFKKNALLTKVDYKMSGEEISYYIKDKRVTFNNEILIPNNRVKTIITKNQ